MEASEYSEKLRTAKQAVLKNMIKNSMDHFRRSVYIGASFDTLPGVFFAAAFALFGRTLTAFFLDDGKLIAQSASFLGVIGLSAPLIGVINIVTSYFQALGKAVNSMIITVPRNVILFIPGVMLIFASPLFVGLAFLSVKNLIDFLSIQESQKPR